MNVMGLEIMEGAIVLLNIMRFTSMPSGSDLITALEMLLGLCEVRLGVIATGFGG